MSKSRREVSPGRLGPARVVPQSNDAITQLDELGAQGDKALEVLKETAEKVVEHVVEPDVDTAVRKAFDDFPPDVRRLQLPDDVGGAAGFVKSTDDRYISGVCHGNISSPGRPLLFSRRGVARRLRMRFG